MSDLHWPAIRAKTQERFRGQAPRAEDEARIVEHFETGPATVLAAIDSVADALAAGRIQWGWSALRARLDKQQAAAPDVSVDMVPSREKRVSQAEAWLRTAGVHLDRVSEVEHELFGTAVLEPTVSKHGEPIVSAGSSLLGLWRDDRELRQRLVDHWRGVRPAGERCEAEGVARMAAQGRQWRELRAEARRRALLAVAVAGVVDDDPEPVLGRKEG